MWTALEWMGLWGNQARGVGLGIGEVSSVGEKVEEPSVRLRREKVRKEGGGVLY